MAKTLQFLHIKHHMVMLVGVTLMLSACSGADRIDLSKNANIDDAIEAATGPLQDLNLRRQEIPEILIKAAVNPYASIKKSSCAEINTELAALNELLGPDMQPSNIALVSGNRGLVDHLERMGDMEMPDRQAVAVGLVDSMSNFAHDSVVNVIHSRTNIMPFRSIIRRISGAESHAEKLANAYQAGKLRRAYIKGVAEMRFGEKCLAKPVVIEASAKTESLF